MTAQAPPQPKLDTLLTRYLQRRTDARQNGVASFDVGDVTPAPVKPIDAKSAWDEAPANWSQTVASHEPVVEKKSLSGFAPRR